MGDRIENDPKDYKNRMDFPMENLAITLDSIGLKKEGLLDHELVEIAAKKLATMHKMLLAAGISKGILDAIMSE